MCKKLVCLILMLVLTSATQAAVSLPAIIGDNMVLQQGMTVPIWGTANSGEQVTVDFDGQSKLTTADGNGDWMVILDPMSASLTGADMVITGDNSITLTDVWVGEVWFASGQSNMNFGLGRSDNWNDAQNDVANHNIRWFKDGTQWEDLASNGTALRNVSAVAYYFTHELTHNLGDVAVGICQATQGGQDITEFTTFRGEPDDGTIYLDRIVPMQPYAIKGTIWYQGENEGASMAKAVDYDINLTGLIDEWRTDWGQGDFPFGIVQLHSEGDGTNRDSWSTVMDAQLRVSLTVANSGLAVNWDTPHTGQPQHPGLKKPLGERLALWARAQVYAQSGFEFSGPIRNPILSSISGNEIIVGFDHIGAGLITDDGQAPASFQVAGSDNVFYDATGQIVGDTVVVSSTSVTNPESVRFAWIGDSVMGNLYNADMLPSPLFKLSLTGGSVCGDATCDPGEDECNCPGDCGTPPSTETTCDDGIDEDCDGDTDCDDVDCDGDPACPSCGDATCDPGEDQCNCPGDCGTPPATETNCTDGIDEDCDGGADCSDPTGDCDTDPACQSACDGDGICEPGEDCNNCSSDCDSKVNGQPSGRYCCGDGEQTGPEGDGRCDGNY